MVYSELNRPQTEKGPCFHTIIFALMAFMVQIKSIVQMLIHKYDVILNHTISSKMGPGKAL